MPKNEYAEFKDTPPIQEQLDTISALVDEALLMEVEIAKAEDALKLQKSKLKDITERQLPELLDQLGLKEVKTKSGQKLQLVEKITHSIAADRKDAAMQWLDDHGHGGLIKRQVFVPFNRDQEAQAKDLLKVLSERFPDVGQDRRVEASTMGAAIKQMLKDGVAIPFDIFGINQFNVVKISAPKS